MDPLTIHFPIRAIFVIFILILYYVRLIESGMHSLKMSPIITSKSKSEINYLTIPSLNLALNLMRTLDTFDVPYLRSY